MIEIRKVQTTDGRRIDHFVESPENIVIEAEDLMLFPALIHPHMHFQLQEKEEAFCITADRDGLVATHTASIPVPVAIELAKKHQVRLYIVEASNQEDLDLIRLAKKGGLSVYAEASPHHLFLSKKDALWDAIHDETIDTLATKEIPHLLPFLLNAYHEKQLSLEQIVSLTHTRPQEIFDLPLNHDLILVDMNRKKVVDQLSLQGWPRYAIINGKLINCK